MAITAGDGSPSRQGAMQHDGGIYVWLDCQSMGSGMSYGI
jgi:hypothetical protein